MRKLVRSLLPVCTLVPLLALAGCGGDSNAAASGQGRGGPGGAQGGGRGERRPPGEGLPSRDVRLVRAESASLPRSVAVTGTLAADEEAELGFKVAGRIGSIAVDLGQPVRRGQAIARLVPTDFELRVAQAQNALEQARARLGIPPNGPDRIVPPQETAVVRQAAATLRQAQLTRERMAKLFSEELIPQQDLDAADAALGVADGRYQEAVEEARTRQALLEQRRSELEIARRQLADSILTAPFDGRVRERRSAIGDYVAAGDTVAVLVRVHPLRLRLAVPEREAAGIRTGQPVRLTVEGDPGTHTGRVARISPSITEDNRTLMIEAEVPNQNGSLRPGAFTRAEIVVEAGAPAVLVPASAVVTFAGIDKVIGVEDGKAAEKRIRIGRRAGDRVEVVEGVEPGDQVIVDPGNLATGQPVQVVG
ncbi:MAG TPA: efflux RND transporter periplasmic adaptor subunit [Thermoanaerobaculia bacterium]|nr:efflux RND transporter periplasmic adaptor subunit [Thermoanaerobaculia bacterium]